MVDQTVLENFWNILLVMEVAVGWMGNGVTGHLGQSVEVIVGGKDTESVTILPLKMEDMTVKESTMKIVFALEEGVLLMEGGEVGLLGQLVEVIVRGPDIEDVTILFLEMEELTVKENIMKQFLALEEDAKSMEAGKVGLLGQIAEMIAKCQDPEVVIIHIPQMEDLTVRETVKKINFALEEVAKLMEVGEAGLIGQLVEVIAKNQDIEDATILFLKMEGMIVKETTRKIVFVMEGGV